MANFRHQKHSVARRPHLKHLTLRLEVEDGWPPVAAESMPCIEESAGLRITVPPLFLKELAVDDLIQVVEESEGQVFRWRLVKSSEHSTIWVMPKKRDVGPALEELRSLGCSTSGFPGGILYAIDLPPTVPASEVDLRFAHLRSEVDIAYPAWRHRD